MSQEKNDLLLDLLIKKATYGLDEAEQRQVAELDPGSADMEFRALEISAAAIGLAGMNEIEPMPVNLRSKIMADADKFYAESRTLVSDAWPARTSSFETSSGSGGRSWFAWLGWAAAAAACVALAVNLFVFRQSAGPTTANIPPVENTVPPTMSAQQKRDQFMSAATDIVKATWATGNVKSLTQLVGDVVWSDTKQEGYMTLRGLPMNDKTKESYQLWIYDKSRDDEPIDGGVFDVNEQGEVIIPIDAKLRASHPDKFAITIEKPGGVVVSKGEKIAALATVETKPRAGA